MVLGRRKNAPVLSPIMDPKTALSFGFAYHMGVHDRARLNRRNTRVHSIFILYFKRKADDSCKRIIRFVLRVRFPCRRYKTGISQGFLVVSVGIEASQ